MDLLLDFDQSLVTAGTSDHSTVLHRAVYPEVEGPECVRVALRYGVDVNHMNDEGLTAAHVAARYGRYRCVYVCVCVCVCIFVCVCVYTGD